jgi:ATP-dependent Lon protease
VRRIGTIGTIQRMIKVPDGTIRCIVGGNSVFRIERFRRRRRTWPRRYTNSPTTRARATNSSRCTATSPLFSKLIGYPAASAARDGDGSQQHHRLQSPDVLRRVEFDAPRHGRPPEPARRAQHRKRMRKLTMLLTKELEVVELGHKIQSDIQREMEKNQREFYLRQQLRAIQEELGETDPQQAETNDLRKKIDEAEMPEEAKQGRRPRTRPALESAAGFARVLGHPHVPRLARAVAVEQADDRRDRHRQARAILDEDHYDLEKVKERIIEYLAVGKLKNRLTGPILCFVGPPGVGKTSLGHSIARRWAASSCASRSAACATKPRSAATGAPTSARCRARSCARCAMPARRTRS